VKTQPIHVPTIQDFRPVPSSCRWKVGIDIGQASTVCQEVYARPGLPFRPSCTVLPSLVAYPLRCPGRWEAEAGSPFEIGEEAMRRRDRYRVVSPLDPRSPQGARALRDFLAGLRREMGAGRFGKPWGVLARSPDAEPGMVREIEALSGEILDRVIFADEPLLAAIGISEGAAPRPATVVDIGKTSIRASLVDGPSPGRSARAVIPVGGDCIDAELRRLLSLEFPDVVLTGPTLTRLKEKLGFVRPARKVARVKLAMGSATRTFDVSEVLLASCEAIVPPLIHAIRDVLGRCDPARLPEFASSIFLIGGGAALPGILERTQAELESAGIREAVVHAVRDPRSITAMGALKWALSVPDGAWMDTVPLRRRAV
jgi:hypothetical protein